MGKILSCSSETGEASTRELGFSEFLFPFLKNSSNHCAGFMCSKPLIFTREGLIICTVVQDFWTVSLERAEEKHEK